MGHFDSDYVQLMWPNPNRAELLLLGAHWGVPNSGPSLRLHCPDAASFCF